MIGFFCHNLETFSLAIDWPQTINLYVKVVIINSFLRIYFKTLKEIKKSLHMYKVLL